MTLAMISETYFFLVSTNHYKANLSHRTNYSQLKKPKLTPPSNNPEAQRTKKPFSTSSISWKSNSQQIAQLVNNYFPLDKHDP